ncbi:putative membrane protein [Aspergillus novofumigatus IBT 16806]|uniref:Very-long-chain (3R)-3-hydroxyacyl-CoA dehydratase n=1 Tax=Aspergillus novofumigatus (strain IBT 16806) TaxID=1392255 RepID=A0A2I1C2Y3_ASPN1|nr:PTPLA-domain-containing protein [Aspergillus novofumigatus IBT 16806]PKX92007.1 PTPLA-domain-containing protein [Aspergillus novofumigatus IBT 16806]
MTIKTTYLILYNTLSSTLWLRILLGAIAALLSPTDPFPKIVYTHLEPQTRWTQTLAIVEILHAATGLTRATVLPTFTQIFTRCVQVWAVNYQYPEPTASSTVYPALLLAWSAADAVRYAYFGLLLAGIRVDGVKWLRYSLFIVLYPVGIGSEWWLMYKAANATVNPIGAGVFYFCLALYVPGAFMMYTYMLKQRRKALERE